MAKLKCKIVGSQVLPGFVIRLIIVLAILSLCVDVSGMTASAEHLVAQNHSACRQKKAPGLCRGKFLRYAYNEETGNCVSFYYTGCASTANNFLTFEECRRDCMQMLRY